MACRTASKSLEDVACADYFHPIALQVCRESRNHTLEAFKRLHHSRVPDCCFYFDPRCDVLWLHRDLKEFDATGLSQVQRVLFKDVERFDDSEVDKKQRRRDLIEMIESMKAVKDVIFLTHWTSIADDDNGKQSETLYDWLHYSLSLMDENWEMLERNDWLLQFLSTWDEFGLCLDGEEARLWGDAREGPLYGCPTTDVVHRKRLVERYPKKFQKISRISL